MDEKPKRRWFQFRLSAWFVLVAILAWAMTCRPLYVVGEGVIEVSRGEFVANWIDLHYGAFEMDDGSLRYFRKFEHRGLNQRLYWPALALAAFLAWKAAWAIGPRLVRRRKSAAPE